MRRIRLFALLALVALHAAQAADLLRGGNARVVFVGDSITGLSRNAAGGWAHQIEWALRQAHPGCQPDLVSLGGSGQGVRSWLNVEERSRREPVFLDIKGVDVQAGLARPADVLVIMLGMNDVLSPYVTEDAASLADWLAGYRQLIAALRARVTPGTLALASATMCTEDPASPKNAAIDRLNEQAAALARELGAIAIPTNQAMRDALRVGRQGRPDFHVTYDFVHPNDAGHLAMAAAMLRALGDEAAAELLTRQRLAPLLERPSTPAPVPQPPAPWLVTAGLAHTFWDGQVFDVAKARGPIEAAIEAGADFTTAADVTGVKPVWRRWTPSVNYTGLDAPGSVDFAGITQARTFEGGYGARWIRADREHQANLDLSTQIFAGTLHLTVWL
ncbi:MAG: hypothetical protein HZB16_22785, partial [Armatimonadetes bacterium]|nr:hypothetical protein [Armatimonadota bacterium]